MESSIEASQIAGMSKPKPVLGPKPRLAPKPFSLQKNTTIRSIHAPKTVTATSKTATQQSGKSEPTAVPTLPTPAWQPTTSEPNPSSISVLTKDQPKTTKETKASPPGEDTLDSTVGKSHPAPQTAPAKEKPKSASLQKDDIIQTNHKASTDIVTKSEQKDEKKKEDKTPSSVTQKLEESGSDVSSAANPTYRMGSTRKRLSMELTSKFESGGLTLPPQPTITISTTSTKDDANKPESLNPEQSQTTSEPSNRASDDGGLKEDYSGGGSIKRRISLLFDSSSRPEVTTKREEPEIINGTGGVKARIKNWATETSSEGPKTEKKPQFVPRPGSMSSEPATPPTAEKTPKMPPAEPSATETTSSQAVDLPSRSSPAKQPTKTPMETSKDAFPKDESSESLRETSGEHMQNKLTEGGVQLRSRSPSAGHTATDEGDSAASERTQYALKRDSVKRRSVHFGVVERDDGGPPVTLGSESDSSEEEGEEEEEEEEEEVKEHGSEDEAEEDIPVSVPVYKRVGLFQKDDGVHGQEAERLKHLEFEKKRRAEESEEVRLKLEEERKRKEEEEREKEKARQMEVEERERERLKEEEMERQRKEEWERVRLEEEKRDRERQREEEMERERLMELMWQRKREEERERAKQKEEKIKQDLEEREKEIMKEEERKEERLREESERQRLREKEEEEERLIHENEEHRLEVKLREADINKKKQREEEWEKEWVAKTENLGRLEEEREREKELERQKEEDRERARQKEERLRQEKEKERLREEAEERERHRRLKEEQEKEEEMERMKQIEMEKQREEERERARQKEERLRQEEKEKERLREEVEERDRHRRLKEEQEKEEAMERMKQIEMEKQREEERERARQKEERLRQEEKEKERLREEAEERERHRRLKEEQEKEEAMERMKQIEMEKQREAERERARQKERLRQEEKEKERLREEAEERERHRRLKEEQEKEEAMERMKQIEMEKQREAERREEERKRQIEKERMEELERKMQEELEIRQAQELQGMLRMEKERGMDGLTNREGESVVGEAEPNLISFDSEDVPPNSQSSYSPLANTYEPTESQMEVVYEDFSVRQPLIEVEFDDFSVKPKRWGSQAKVETSPVIQSWAADPMDKEEVDVSTWENKVPEQVENADSLVPTLAQERKEEEEQLISISMEVEEEEKEKEGTTEDEVKEDDKKEAQGNSYCTNGEDKETDALIDNEPDQQNEACEQTPEIDSLNPVPDHDLEASSQDVDTTDFHRVADLTPFPESATPLLDSSAQKSKADLGKRRIRTRPSRSLRAGSSQRKSPDWTTRDSTDETEASCKRKESDSEDEQPKPKIVCSPPPTSQRVPIFPGLSPAALIAQIKRRTVGGGPGGGEETEEDEGREKKESQNEEAAPSPSQLSCSPRSAAHLAGAARVLPPLSGTDRGAASCPAWLKELKSKKRLSQYDGEA